MRALLYRALILLAIIGLVVTPPILTGYREIQRAESALKVNDISHAANSYERAARLLPWSPGLWEQAGQLRFKQGNFDQTITLLEKAKQSDPLSASGWDILGISYFGQTGELGKAVETWKTGLAYYPSYSMFYYRLAIAYYGQNDYPAERDALEHWASADGDKDARAHYRLGLLLAVSEPERALGEFLLAASFDPQFDSAVETMRAALNLASLETDESSKLVLIGRGLGLVNEWTLAVDAFRQAVAADEQNAEAWAWLGEAEQQMGQDGRVELDKALSLDPTNPIVHSLRGVYWMRQERGDQALAEYLLAAEYDPENPAWEISIAEAHTLRGDLQAALANYLRATEMAPTDVSVWRALAAFSAQYNMQLAQVGLPAAQKAVELSGEDPLSLDMLGWTLALLNRYEEARDTLEHALNLDPGLPQAHLHLGILALQTDDWQAAKDHFQQARDLDPDGPVGEQAQMLLNQYFP